MSNVKILSSSKAAAPAATALYNLNRKKLLINGPATGTAGTYTLDGGANLTIAAGTTVILEGYIGAAAAGNSAQLVEVT